MQKLPEIGEGVRVPWGLDLVPAEVVDVIPPDHAVVRVLVEGASGEPIDSTTISSNIAALSELPPWRVTRTRHGRPTPGADASEAWWFDLERDGEKARVEVRVSGSLAATRPHGRLPQEAARALQTQGRSAVDKFARQFRLPQTIVVGTHGVFELSS